MTSLTTPVSPTPMGAGINGTDKPYIKVIYDIDIDATIDKIEVKLFLGVEEDEDWTDEEIFTVSHQKLEKWLEETDRLICDDTHYIAAYDGHATEIGEVTAVCYTDYIRDPGKLDMIAFLKAKNIIPDYKIDQSLIKINSI